VSEATELKAYTCPYCGESGTWDWLTTHEHPNPFDDGGTRE